MRLERTVIGGVEVLSVASWLEEGIVHGFAGSSLDMRGGRPPEAFLNALSASRFVAPKQVHGTAVLDLRGCSEEDLDRAGTLEADGLLVEPGRRGVVVGIRTADCMPILARAGSAIALVHAGWRGLAAGIVENAVETLSPLGDLSLAFGPCIGSRRFEVGDEVLDALGAEVVFERDARGVAMVSLVETAIARIRRRFGDIVSVDSAICTYDHAAFHSYRRDGSASGRNLTFLKI